MDIDHIETLVKTDVAIQRFIRDPEVQCDSCAEKVLQILTSNEATRHLVKVVYVLGIWCSDNFDSGTHFAVGVYEPGCSDDHTKGFVIDPTFGQFEGGQPLFCTYEGWINSIRLNFQLRKNFIKLLRFKNFSEANRAMMLPVSVHEFKGETIVHKEFNPVATQSAPASTRGSLASQESHEKRGLFYRLFHARRITR